MTRETDKYLFFWQSDSPFSNWYPECYSFTKLVEVGAVGQITLAYDCSEQEMMAKKALLFHDMDSYVKICKESDPAEIKKLGRKVKNFDSAVWEAKREEIMYEVIKNKFTYSSEATKKVLEDTKGKIIVEASPFDMIWGIGLRPDDLLADDEDNWKGLNLLGKALTKFRIDTYGE